MVVAPEKDVPARLSTQKADSETQTTEAQRLDEDRPLPDAAQDDAVPQDLPELKAVNASGLPSDNISQTTPIDTCRSMAGYAGPVEVAPAVFGLAQPQQPQVGKLVQNAELNKAEGVALFQSGQYYRAYQVWRCNIDELEAFGADRLGEDGQRTFVALCLNAAQALLKCPEIDGAPTEIAASMADKALSVDPNNTRALFRRGCAYSNAKGWLLARKDFEQVLRLEPNNEAARRELEKLEEALPPAAPDVVARRQEQLPAATVPHDADSAVRMAQKEAERFRREILAVADKKGAVPGWCKKFNKVQVMTAEWAKHQLKDPEILQDLLILRGPLFQAMNDQQREDFLCAYDFVQEVRQRHQDEIDRKSVV